MINKIRDFVADIKIFMGRAQSYVSLANSGMIGILFLSKMKELEYISWDLNQALIPIFFLSVLGMIGIGYIEDKIKLHDAENRRVADRNPYMKDIIERLDRMEKQNKGELK